MKKFFLISMIFIVLLVSFISAESFTTEIISSENLIQQDEQAKFKIQVTNNLDKENFFRVSSSLDGWNVHTNPLSDYTFSIPAKGQRILNLVVSPRVTFDTRPYTVPVRIRSITEQETKQVNLRVQIYRPEQMEYLPTVVPDIIIPYENDPRENIPVEVYLNNLNRRNITSLNIEIRSSLFEDKREIELGPLVNKIVEFNFDVDGLTEPFEDRIKLRISTEHDNREFVWERESLYRISSYNELIKERIEDSSFLRSEIKINLKNDANVKEKYEIPIKVGYLKSLFTSFEPNYNYVLSSEEGRFLVWNVELDAQEEASIYVRTSYISLVLFILLIIAVIITYYVLRPPIKIKKEVSHVGTSEGGISDIKVMLFVKNRTSKVIEDISIIEKIPHLASIGKEFQVGTLMPSKVMQNPKKGTLVKWNLQTLEANEERIITYKIKSKLSILGGLTLPSTIIKYSIRGKESKTKSNRLTLEI